MNKVKNVISILVVAFLLVTNADAGILYGVTSQGGTNNSGVLFHFNDSTNSYTIDTNFDLYAQPYGSLIKATDGMLYGITQSDGPANAGTIFRFNPSNGILTTLFSLNGTTQGGNPQGSLMQATNGLLYGMTQYGGSHNGGTLFSFNLSNDSLITLQNLDANAQPWGSLIQASNGLLYGLTTGDGNNFAGTLFSYNITNNSLNIVHYFVAGTYGAVGGGESLIQTPDGKIYGLTTFDGTHNFGTIFEFNDTTNVVTVLYNFTTISGISPNGGLIRATNGMFYGQTFEGGSNNDGTIFKFNSLNDSLTVVVNFNYTNGDLSTGTLFQASNGNIYGMTSGGGSSGDGTLFQFDPNNNILTTEVNFDSTNGSGPYYTALMEYSTPCNVPAQPGAITGSDSVCVSTNQTYSVAAVPGATSYNWTLPNGWTTQGSTTNSITGTAFSAGTISVTANDSCGSSAAQTMHVGLNGPPGTPSGLTQVLPTNCQGQSQSFTVTILSVGPITYNWTFPSDWNPHIQQTSTGQVSVQVGSLGGIVSVQGSNVCGAGLAETLNVVITPVPVQPGAITGNTSVTAQSQQVYSIVAVPNATNYIWTLPNGWTGSSTSNTITVTVACPGGTISVTANNTCGSSTPQTLAVTVGASFPENFEETTFPPNCWTISNNTPFPWSQYIGASAFGIGNQSAMMNFYSETYGDSEQITTPVFTPTLAGYNLIFDEAYATYVDSTDYLQILSSINGGATWTQVAMLEGGLNGPLNTGGSDFSVFIPNSTQWRAFSFPLPTGTNMIQFNGISGYGNDLYLDDVNIGPSCVINPIITANGNTNLCIPASVTLTVDSNYYSINWSNGATTQSITVSTTGDYTVSVTNNNNCTGTASMQVTAQNCNNIQFCDVLYPTQCGYIASNSPTSNWYTHDDFLALFYPTNVIGRGMMQFDFSNIPNNAVIDSARLSLYWFHDTQGNPGQYYLQGTNACWLERVTQQWSATNVTWNTQPLTDSINNLIPIPESTNDTESYPNIDIRLLVQAMMANPNYGFLMRQQNENGQRAMRFASMYNTDSSILPRLSICYHVPSISCVPPTPAAINGPTMVCTGSQVTYSIPPDSGATSYTWTLPNGWSGASTSTTINVIAGITGGVISVTANDSCGSSPAQTLNVVVNSIQIPIITSNGPDTFCLGDSLTLSVGAYPLYDWSNGASTEAITVTTSGNYSVTVSNGNGCSAMASQQVFAHSCVPMQTICNTLNPVHSAIVNNYLSDSLSNFNNFPDFYSNAWTENSIPFVGRGLMEFDFTSIPNNANVYSAALSLYGYNSTSTPELSDPLSGSNASTLRRITSLWNSSSVTWHTQPSTTTTNEVQLPESTSPTEDYLNINILGMVNDMIANGNYGFMMILDTEQYYRSLVFATMNNPDSAVFPRLDLCYSIPLALATNQTPTTLCTGGSLQVSFSSFNQFSNGNVFTAQLSDSSGSFASPITIGSLTSTTPGNISVTIPSNTIAGSHYRIRIVSSNIAITGSDNGSDITIAPLASPIINTSGPTTFCQGGSVTLSVATYSTYSWSNGSSLQSIIVTAEGNYTVTVSNGSGCTGMASQVVIVNQNVIDSITANGPTNFCHGDSVTLNAGTFSTYLWSTGATVSHITVSTTGTYSVTISNNSGCTGTASISVNASAVINPVITTNGPSTFCQGGSVTLDAGSGYAAYHWSDGKTTESITDTVTGTFRVTVTNSSGCTGTATQSVNVFFLPSPVITVNGSTSLCNGGSVTLDAGSYVSYLWNTSATTETITATTASTYIVTVTDVHNCTASASQAVSVNPSPTPTITPNGPTTLCQGGSVMLNAGNYFSYHWNTNATTESITANTTGTYSVTVSFVSGCTGTTSINVTVSASPSPTITPNGPITFCNGGSVTLDAGNWTAYNWSTGASSEAISASTSGNFMVTVTDSNGCNGMASIAVTVNANPTPSITGITSICSGNSTTLSTASYSSYSWSTGASTQSISVSSSGTYSITVTNNNGCMGTASQVVTVHNNPSPTITPNGPTTICQGASVALNAGTYASYLWNNGATAGTIIANTTGTFTVTVTDANGCTGTASIAITVNPSPIVSITANNSTTFCENDSVTLNAGSWASYSWNTGNTTQFLTVYGSQPYCVTATNSNGCTGTACQFVDVFALPTPSITANGPTTFCSGGSVGLSVGTYATYLWSTGATTATINATTSGVYSVTVANINNCSASASIGITALPSPTPVISPSGPTTLCQGGSVTLNAGTYASYHWMNSQTTQSILVLASGNYVVTVTGNNGCTGSTSQVVTVSPFTNPTILANGPVVFCAGGSVTLDAGTYATYSWSNGASTETITTGTSGLYTVTVSNGANCSSTAIKSVTSNPAPVPVILVTNLNNLCGGGYVRLNVGASFPSYLWSIGATTQLDSVNIGGTYTVTVTSSQACTGTASTTVTSGCTIPVIAATPTTNIGANYAMGNWIQPSCHVSYNVRISLHNINNWTTTTIASNSHYTFSGLVTNTMYDWEVQTNCNAQLTAVSGYSAPQTFTTLLREESDAPATGITTFNVYPNPASDQATIVFSSTNEEVYTIRMIDIIGKEILSTNITSVIGDNQYQMNLSAIAKGIYMVILQNNNGTLQRKIVVQ